ncbi:MAG TPA: hypothetical protein VM243_03485 [Phycisphaerae bacterium]|nr:hypothetical protein [Phycisphaerae bacterium]
MSAYKPSASASRSTRRHTLVGLAALLLVAGGTFAATGGIDTIRQWLVTVEVNGQVHEFTTDDNGIGSFTIETDDGQAEVQVQMATSPDGGEVTSNITISAESPDGGMTRDIEVQRRVRTVSSDLAGDSAYTVDDLGDTEPAAEWVQDGVTNAVYLVPNGEDEGVGFKVFAAATTSDGETIVNLAAAPPVALPENEDDISVELADDGMLTITIGGEGEEMVMNLAFATAGATGPACCDPDEPLEVETPDGEITITLDAIALEGQAPEEE